MSRASDIQNRDEAGRRRDLAAELYRPDTARLIIVGEAPPPERFFYFGDSLFLGYLRKAFAPQMPEVEQQDAGWFLAFFRALGGWRIDVCDAPKRATRGGADDVSDCLEGFERRWMAQPRHEEAVLVISPKRLVPSLPRVIQVEVTASVPPPGQWNAHRQAFLREMDRLLRSHLGRDALETAAALVDADEAALEFEVARACAEGAAWEEIDRLVRGHPREEALRAVAQGNL